MDMTLLDIPRGVLCYPSAVWNDFTLSVTILICRHGSNVDGENTPYLIDATAAKGQRRFLTVFDSGQTDWVETLDFFLQNAR